MTFASLGLPAPILKGIRAAGLTEPTAIQSKAIPTILQGNDLIGQAQSGSGKTGAYVVPILARLLDTSRRLRALILVPTRELAQYVETRTRDYARYTDIRVGVVFSGGALQQQERMLREDEVDILVATPSRLLELLERKCLNVENIETLVLEEADRMVALGLAPDLRKVLKALPETRQTLMFAMSMPPELNRLAKEALIEPVRVDMAPGTRPGAGVRQVIYPVPRDLKPDFLNELLSPERVSSDVRNTVLFARARYGAERLAKQLQRRGFVTRVLDEHPSQGEREQALEDLKRGKLQILVASDAAGRALDVAGLSHVINYDVPPTPEDYAHRLGRSGRPDVPSDVFTLMSPEEQKDVAGIERFLGRTIERSFLRGFDYGMKPREIQQAVNYEEPGRRRAAGVQSAAARIAANARPPVPARASGPTGIVRAPTPPAVRPVAQERPVVAPAPPRAGTTPAPRKVAPARPAARPHRAPRKKVLGTPRKKTS